MLRMVYTFVCNVSMIHPRQEVKVSVTCGMFLCYVTQNKRKSSMQCQLEKKDKRVKRTVIFNPMSEKKTKQNVSLQIVIVLLQKYFVLI